MSIFSDLKVPSSKQLKLITWIVFFLSVGFTIWVYARFWDYKTDGGPAGPQDIYFLWEEGGRLLAGENPYDRIASGNMLENDKYATHFPLFYMLASATRLAGFQEYPEWVGLWRYIFLFFNFAIAALLFYLHYRADQLILAMFIVPFWLLNRWTLYVGWIAHVDFITVFLLLVSLVIFEKRMWLALLLFSLSLAIKHLAIFMVPVYLIWVWQLSEQNKIKKVALAMLIIGSIPAISSIPFFIWHPETFIRSIVFSVTREPAGLVPQSLDVILEIIGFPGRIPMLVLMGLLYLAVAYKQIGKYACFLLIMFVFINFSPVLFPQYHTWIVPFLSISISSIDKIPGLSQSTGKS